MFFEQMLPGVYFFMVFNGVEGCFPVLESRGSNAFVLSFLSWPSLLKKCAAVKRSGYGNSQNWFRLIHAFQCIAWQQPCFVWATINFSQEWSSSASSRLRLHCKMRALKLKSILQSHILGRLLENSSCFEHGPTDSLEGSLLALILWFLMLKIKDSGTGSRSRTPPTFLLRKRLSFVVE